MGENLLPRTLLILRHGSAARDTDVPSDFDRTLDDQGARDAPRVGRWLCGEGLVPDRILSSPAKRAEQTVLRVVGAMGMDAGAVSFEVDAYGAEPETWLGFLAALPPEARTVLLVGHNPGLERLVEFLAADDDAPSNGRTMVPAALAQLKMPGDWRALDRGCAELVRIRHPDPALNP